MIYKLKEEVLELKGEAEILRNQEKTLKREVERNRDTIRALEEALEEAVKGNGNGNQHYTPKRSPGGHDQVALDDDENEDNEELEYKKNPQTEALISEIVALKKRIKELESGRRDDPTFDEETKDTHDRRGDTTEVFIG